MGAVLLASAIWLPPYSVVMLLLLLLVCVLGTGELYGLLKAAGIPNFNRIGVVGGAGLLIGTWWAYRADGADLAADCEWGLLFLVALVILVRLFPQKTNEQPLQTIGATFLGIMYVPFMLNFLNKLLVAWPNTDGRVLVLYMLFVVKFTDIGAYFTGMAIGKHKFWPRISPKKTWEGFFGGVATGVLVSVLFYLVTGGNLRVVTITLTDALILGVVLSVIGTMGDLMESLLKRSAGIKDSSTIVQGMGGVLDVIDSLLFASPVLYIYARIFLERVAI